VGDRIAIDLVTQRLDDIPKGFNPASRSKPWGTGQAILAARVVTTPLAIINADDFYGQDAYRRAPKRVKTPSRGASRPPWPCDSIARCRRTVP
jgi:hypothetical protein